MRWNLYEHAIDALRFWERGRLVYNGVLLLLTIVMVAVRWRDAHYLFHQNFGSFLSSVVIANVLYCAAYLVEPLLLVPRMQQDALLARRVVLFGGTAFACLLAFADLNLVLLAEPFLDD
jgi:hypothetical protein